MHTRADLNLFRCRRSLSRPQARPLRLKDFSTVYRQVFPPDGTASSPNRPWVHIRCPCNALVFCRPTSHYISRRRLGVCARCALRSQARPSPPATRRRSSSFTTMPRSRSGICASISGCATPTHSPQQPTAAHSSPQQPTAAHSSPQRPTAAHADPQQPTATHSSPPPTAGVPPSPA